MKKILEGFRKLFYFRSQAQKENYTNAYEKKLSEALELLVKMNLSEKYFLKLSLDKRIFLHFKVLYRSIDQYVVLFKRLTYTLTEEEVFRHGVVSYELTDISLESFLTTTDGYYLDQRVIITLFVTSATTFLQTLLNSKRTYSPAEYDHNLRLSAQLVDNLFELARALKSV